MKYLQINPIDWEGTTNAELLELYGSEAQEGYVLQVYKRTEGGFTKRLIKATKPVKAERDCIIYIIRQDGINYLASNISD